MADISNKTLAVLVGIALVVSLVGIFSLPQGGLMSVTGLGTTGIAKINITELAALNVTQTVIDFGNGSIEQGAPGSICTLATDDASFDPNNCWTSTYGSTDGFHVENVGNTDLDVTVTSTMADANAFFGTTGDATAVYDMKCSGNGTVDMASYTALSTSAQACVSSLSPTAGSDAFRADIKITIPAAATGYHTDTLTFTGAKSA